MKKKTTGVVVLAAIVAATSWNLKDERQDLQLSDLTLTNIEAVANINPLCPNGCVAGEEDCYCYGMHYKSEEYDWGE
jgi:hypothetical protein